MDSRWFKEDRAIAHKDKSVSLADLQKESQEALKNSTLFSRRLEGILNDYVAETERSDEDFSQQNWELINVSNISRRKTLREIIKLIQLK